MSQPDRAPEPQPKRVLERADLEGLFDTLRARGYQLVGPTLGEGAIVYDHISSSDDLPAGWTDEQEAGTYRLVRRGDQVLFAFSLGPHSWKRFLLPPLTHLWRARRGNGGLQVVEEGEEPPRYAFIGARPCELRAIAIQDRVFLQGPYVDPVYRARREGIFVVAVNCGRAGGTCFCASVGSGPRASEGFDLALTEVLEGGRHYFLAEAGSQRGAELLAELPLPAPTAEEEQAAEAAVARAAAAMGRSMDTGGIKELLYRSYESPRWEEVAGRCLTCGNCTMVCPTCFCTTIEDVSDLKGEEAGRLRRWDSCFTTSFSYIHGGNIRASAKSRYRQWLTHKLATWIDQFGTSGCVGCGRCITWCPAGIDITEEVAAIRSSETAEKARAAP